MVSTFSGSYTSHGIEYIAPDARAPSNLDLHIKGETLVELYDDAYYFWHPGTETFLNTDSNRRIVGTRVASQHWEVRHNLVGLPNSYYTFWGQELHGKRKMVLDLDHGILTSGTKILVWEKLEGDNQRWILRSDGDEDGYAVRGPPPVPASLSLQGPGLPVLNPYTGTVDRYAILHSARGLTISPRLGLHSAISMEKVNGNVEGFLRPRTGGKDQIFIPLRVQGPSPPGG